MVCFCPRADSLPRLLFQRQGMLQQDSVEHVGGYWGLTSSCICLTSRLSVSFGLLSISTLPRMRCHSGGSDSQTHFTTKLFPAASTARGVFASATWGRAYAQPYYL